ncbi:hypothetical protein Tco_1319850 [Tanacetum coccineum]
MMEKVLTDQRGRNVEVYLEEIVVKSTSEQSLVQDVEETLRKLKRVNIKIDPNTSSFELAERKFLGHMVTKEGVRTDPEKFIPKLAKLKYPINKVRMRMDAMARFGWKNEDKEALQRIKKIEQIANVGYPEGRRKVDAIPTTKKGDDKLCSNGSVVKKFFGQRELGQKTPGANEGETSNLNKELQVKLIPTPRAWRLYSGKETIEKGSGVGIILVSPDEKMHSYAIRLKFNASDHVMDCEALLA